MFVSRKIVAVTEGIGLARLAVKRSAQERIMITITETARQKIVMLGKQLSQPIKGVRVRAIPRSPLRASFAMKLMAEGEPALTADVVQTIDEVDVYVDADSAPYLEQAAIDYVFTPMASGFRIMAPPRKLDTPEGKLAARVQKVLDSHVNRSLFLHGGGAALIDVQGDTVFVEMTGGCQGCSQAATTMSNEIAAVIKEHVPEIKEVFDVTEHAAGKNPYYTR